MTIKTAIKTAIQRLEGSERGQLTCKQLLDFLKSPTVQGLDGCNSHAVALLVSLFMLNGGNVACEVVDSLKQTVERNSWVNGDGDWHGRARLEEIEEQLEHSG